MTTEAAPNKEGIDSLPPGLNADDCFDVLSNQRRRYAVAAVARNGGMAADGLVNRVAARETGRAVGRLDATERKRVYVALQQSHLPRLDDAGVIIHDRSAGRVGCGPHLQAVAWYLSNGPARQRGTVFETLGALLGRGGEPAVSAD